MNPPAKNIALGSTLVALGLALAAGGIYLGETDDSPGAGIGSVLLMLGLVTWGVKIARRKA